MNNKMMQARLALLLAASLAVAGCGGDTQTVVFPGRGAEVFYTYPDADQRGVSTHTPIVVRLSDPLTEPDSLDSSMIQLVRDADNAPIATTIEVASGSADRSIVLRPLAPLASGETYRVDVLGLSTTEGPVQFANGSFSFTTALAIKGPRSGQIADNLFAVSSMFPDNNALPILDFSSLRLRFNQPLDPASIRYGETLALKDSNGLTIDATILSSNHFLTIDPVADLIAGQTYTLTLSNQVVSRYGVALEAPFDGSDSFSFVPLASGPTEIMALQAPATGELSVLTGQPINLVPVIATLLGDNTQSQQQGDVFTELAFVPNYPLATPLRISRGSLLKGDALDVRVSGEVPAGFDSGDVTVQFISDASGYLLPNPYSDAPDAPRQIRVMMDVAILTGNAVANAGFTQDVLHLELIGQAIVENGLLTSDALTVVESDVLGLETAFGVLSFRMTAYSDQIAAPAPPVDSIAPAILSWMPGDENALKQRKGDPLMVNFTEAMDPSSLEGRVQVWANGIQTTDISVRLDGSSLVINTPLDYNTSYDIELLDGITDIAGNTLPATTLSFDMAEYVVGPLASPFVTTSYPGTPCVIVPASRDLTNNVAGRCNGGQTADDTMPLAIMPADRGIRVRFSQNMDIASIVLGQSFRVEQIDAAGAVLGSVDGQLTVRDRALSFVPDEPWQEDALYQYVLISNNSGSSSACTPGSTVCGADGLPLKTRLLSQTSAAAPTLNGGGPNLVIQFRAGAAVPTVYTQLANLPTADVNGNALRDAGEDNAVDNPEMLKNSTRMEINSTGGSISNANIGCPVGQQCPEQAIAYITGALDGEVVGYFSATDIPAVAKGTVPQAVLDAGGGILVYLYPNVMTVSESTVYSQTSIIGTTADPASTGPLIMRMRHQCDARVGAIPAQPNAASLGPCNGHHGLVEGWIIEGISSPEFLATLDLYLDAPALQPVIRILGIPSNADHNLRSYGLPSVSVRGPVAFIDDGRMEITQLNQADIFANIEISAVGGFAGGNVLLRIPTGGINLNYISAAVKH
jgi:hypothetical protein